MTVSLRNIHHAITETNAEEEGRGRQGRELKEEVRGGGIVTSGIFLKFGQGKLNIHFLKDATSIRAGLFSFSFFSASTGGKGLLGSAPNPDGFTLAARRLRQDVIYISREAVRLT